MTTSLQEAVRHSGLTLRERLGPPDAAPAELTPPACPPDQGCNHGAIRLACGLLSLVRDLKAFVQSAVCSRAFDLRRAYGIDPAPLFNLNPHSPALVRTVKAVFDREHAELKASVAGLLDDIRRIDRDRLLGAETTGKMAYVREVTGVSLARLSGYPLEDQLVGLRGRTLELLSRQARRLGPGHPRRPAVDGMMAEVGRHASAYDVLFYRLRSLCDNHPRRVVGFQSFCEIYRDEIAEELARHLDRGPEECELLRPLRFVRGQGVEVAYVRRDQEFLTLGDAYGDCTAQKPRKQAVREEANIHWTVYTWLLDPFYRVLEVTCDGERALKAHLLPLLVRRQRVLVVDAIEVVPKLRDVIRGEPNPHRSERLFARRHEIIQALYAAARDVGARMGADAVHVDRFSNAGWVRAVVDTLPRAFYHVREVEKPFGLEPVRQCVREWLGLAGAEVRAEIQAVNLLLMDQGLKDGYKEVGVLSGTALPSKAPLRGP